MSRWRGGMSVLMPVFLAACAGDAGRKAPVDERLLGDQPPVEERVVGAPDARGSSAARSVGTAPAGAQATPQPRALPAEPRLEATPLPAPEGVEADPVSPAVVALLNDAGRQARGGEHEAAAASLERALEIEPRNAWLWHRLAVENLALDRLDESAGMAAKSNALAGDNARLQADNWRLIAAVRERQGRDGEAAEAARRAEALSGKR